MARKSTFIKGSSTFICNCCGHNTRWTGEQSVDAKICPICWDLAGLENMLSDDGAEAFEEYKGEVTSNFNQIAKRSAAELVEALKAFPTLAPYYNAAATTEEAATPVAAIETEHSLVKGPVAICKALLASNPSIPRKDFIAQAVERGVLKATASTQFNRIKKG